MRQAKAAARPKTERSGHHLTRHRHLQRDADLKMDL
jgi:hypothetical protein